MEKGGGLKLRERIANLIENNTDLNVYAINQFSGACTKPYAVLKMLSDSSSANRFGFLSRADLMIYVPDSSIYQLDHILNKCTKLLMDNEFEIESSMSDDYHDEEKSAYMRSVTVYAPKTI